MWSKLGSLPPPRHGSLFPKVIFGGLAVKREATTLSSTCLMFVVLSLPARAQVSFFWPPTYSGSGSNQFVADFNGDGKLDILSSDGTMNLGNGDGTFKLGIPVPGTSNSMPVLAVADFNGDGKPDILELGTDTLLVLLGNGDGTFQAPVSSTSNAGLSVIAAGDLNGDGKADVVGVFGSSLMVYISNGNGTFAAGVSYNLGPTSGLGDTLLSLGDFNSDGNTDVVVTLAGSNLAGQEIVFLGNGDGTFQTTPKTSAGPYYPQRVTVGDFNGDGKLDLLVGSACFGNCTIPTIYLLLGNGDGTFQAPAPVASLGGATGVAADLNGDGKLDLVVSGGAGVIQIYLGNGDGTFSNTNDYGITLGGGPAISVADFTGSGNLDVAEGGVILGNGDGTFQGIQMGIAPSGLTAAVAGAFQNKGAFDIAVLSYPSPESYSSNSLYIFSNNGSGALSLIHTYPLQQAGIEVATADFNGDGNLDLLVVGVDSTTQNWGYSVLLGNGDGSFQAPVYYPQSVAGGGSGDVADFNPVVADFNNDKKLDFVVPAGDQSVAVVLGNGDGTFASPLYYYDEGFGSLVVADFNGKGKLDVAAGGGGQTGILYGNGDGTFQAMVLPTSLNKFVAAFTADVNNDGIPDLLSSNQVALGNGDGTFTQLPPLVPGNGETFSVGQIADFNGDGKLDLLGAAGGGAPPALDLAQTGILLGNGDGTFGSLISVTTFANGPLDTFLVADMDGDGRPDIVFPWEQLGVSSPPVVAVLVNTTPPGFGLLASALSPSPVTAGSSASSTLTVSPTFGFTGTVNLTCAITPAVTPAATCTLSSSSVQITGTGTQTVTVNVGTTAPLTTGAAPGVNFQPGLWPLVWTLMLLASAWVWVRNRKRLPALAAPIMVAALALLVSCGGSGSSSNGTTAGTPPGTYAVTITATSGSVSNNVALQVIVQ
jgi:hypothetical protein